MKIRDIIRFREEDYFNGAVQTEWYYDPERVGKIAKAYVFHGPRYFGVSKGDISQTEHKLIDTASFTKKIADKLYADQKTAGNRFVMTIAGYGTGKSHLAVCLGALFGGDPVLRESVTANLSLADEEIGAYVGAVNTKKNFVLVLNGMSNFNLDAEILKLVRLELERNHISDEFLHQLTKAYDIAARFVEKNFETHEAEFESQAKKTGIFQTGEALKKYLTQHILDNSGVLNVISEVYFEVNGDHIRWDRGISAGEVLKLVRDTVCGEGKTFHKILILFDEFGRYIEYAAANPAVAGEAALQQIFEAVQGADDGIVFNAFIQNDLSAYLSRIEKTSNIVRYVGRFENSEKLYLSSNFETILANLLKVEDEDAFTKLIHDMKGEREANNRMLFEALKQWDRSAQKKGVWTSYELYRNVILDGCYPLHPITVWMLSGTSSWMQQRSTIAFAAEMFGGVKAEEIDPQRIPYIYPVDIIDSNIYNEMLSSEEKGLVASQYCMLYRDIVVKLGSKLTANEKKVLKAVLILNLGRFSFSGKEDAVKAIEFCCDLSQGDLMTALKSLEDMHGVVAFDDNSKTFDLIAEANGFNEFRRVFMKYYTGTTASIDDIDSDTLQELKLAGVEETAFAQDHSISSAEWCFERRLVDADHCSESYLKTLRNFLDKPNGGDAPRGYLVWVYCNVNRDAAIRRISDLYTSLNLQAYAVIILFLDDAERAVSESLRAMKAIFKFSAGDKERFGKQISTQLHLQKQKVVQQIKRMMAKRQMICGNGVVSYTDRINGLCTKRFEVLYPGVTPFVFDGFQNKDPKSARRYLITICTKLFDRTLMNIQSYQALAQDEKNRVKSCLAVDMPASWQVFAADCSLTEPRNAKLKAILNDVDSCLKEDAPVPVMALMGKYLRAPYGMNTNAIVLFVFYYLAYKGNAIYVFYGQTRLQPEHLSDKIFKNGKIQQTEFEKLNLQINPHADVDLIAEACRKAQLCSDISMFESWKKKLDDLIAQEGLSAADKPVYFETVGRLNVGNEVWQKMKDNLEKAHKVLSECSKRFELLQFVGIFKLLPDVSAQLSDEYPEFIIGEVTKTEIASIRGQISQLLKVRYSASLLAVTCEITELSTVKGRYGKVAEYLQKNGYPEYAKATKERIERLENELFIKQKYEASLVELQKDLSMYSELKGISFGGLSEAAEKMKKWEAFLTQANDMPKDLLEGCQKKIREAVYGIEKRKQEVMKSLSTALASADSAAGYSDLVKALADLKRFRGIGLDESNDRDLELYIDRTQHRMDRTKALPESIDILAALAAGDEIKKDIAVYSEAIILLQKLQKKEIKWIHDNIESFADALDEKSSEECVGWLETTSSAMPQYISAKTRKQYLYLKANVEQRLQTCRIDGVVSMFEHLTEDEKKKCLKILLGKA